MSRRGLAIVALLVTLVAAGALVAIQRGADLAAGTPLEVPLRQAIGAARSELRSDVPRCEGPTRVARPVDIVLIAVDTLRADHLGFHGYARDISPNLDTLARDSVVFDRAISAAPWTTPAFTGVFTGSHPAALGIGLGRPNAAVPADAPLMATLLCEAGWQTAGVVSHSYVGLTYGFDRGFEQWDERNAGGHMHVSSASVTELALEALDGFDADRPFFLFAHYFDPHYDYLEHEGHVYSQGYTGSVRSENDNIIELALRAAAGELDAADIQHLIDRYDSEIAHTDAEIGRLLGALRARGTYDDALVIFLSDHGEMFVEREQRMLGHKMHVYEPMIRVPLFLKLPGLARIERVGAPVSTVDVLPTVLDVIGHPEPPAAAPLGRSLLRLGAASTRPVFAQTRSGSDREAVYADGWKLVHDAEAGTSELYALERDPDERDDLAPRHPDVVRDLEARLTRWNSDLRATRETVEPTLRRPLSEEEKQRLRDLGYVE